MKNRLQQFFLWGGLFQTIDFWLELLAMFWPALILGGIFWVIFLIGAVICLIKSKIIWLHEIITERPYLSVFLYILGGFSYLTIPYKFVFLVRSYEVNKGLMNSIFDMNLIQKLDQYNHTPAYLMTLIMLIIAVCYILIQYIKGQSFSKEKH